MTDRRVFFAVVAFLGGTLVLTVAAIGVLAGLERGVPGILENVAVGCLTGLAGLLARGPAGEPQPVEVRQPAGRPVPVEEHPGELGESGLDLLVKVCVAVVVVVLTLYVVQALL